MAASPTEETVDLHVLVDLEQQFYDVGYEDGLAHGAIHGRIEGRELGREKGFEMWEELGFYEGFAKLWKAVAERKESNDGRVTHNANLLLDLVAQFPIENPSHTGAAEVDIPKLFNQIRSRYKMLCALVGVKPSLRASHVALQDDGGVLRGKNVWGVDSAGNPGGADYSF